jgi:hypothetical protein
MKELNAFRKFLNENKLSPDGEPLADIDPSQTIFSVNFKDFRESQEVGLYVAVDTEKEAKMLAQQYMDEVYPDSFELVNSRNLGTFGDLDPYGEQDAELWKGKIADFGYA